jgi:hypothetical protein
MPSLTASAFTPPSSFSRTARHIAHWALDENPNVKEQNRKKIIFFKFLLFGA